MTTRLSIPDRALLEDQVRQLLEQARQRADASVTEMVEALGGLQARGAGSRRSWYDWHERPETVSALTTLGALHFLGPDAVLELLFEKKARGEAPGRGAQAAGDTRIAELATQVATLAELVHSLQQAMDVVQEQLLRAETRQHGSLASDEVRKPKA